ISTRLTSGTGSSQPSGCQMKASAADRSVAARRGGASRSSASAMRVRTGRSSVSVTTALIARTDGRRTYHRPPPDQSPAERALARMLSIPIDELTFGLSRLGSRLASDGDGRDLRPDREGGAEGATAPETL